MIAQFTRYSLKVIVAVVADSEDIVTADLEMMDSMRSMAITCTFLKGKRFESYCMESIIKQAFGHFIEFGWLHVADTAYSDR